MVAMSHHNLGAMHEATKRADMTELNYKRAHDIAEQYLGPASQIAGTHFTGFTSTKVHTLTQKLEAPSNPRRLRSLPTRSVGRGLLDY
jgi:hypothetical protein